MIRPDSRACLAIAVVMIAAMGFGRCADAQTIIHSPVYGQPVQSYPVQGQPIYGQPVYGQPIYGEPIHGKIISSRVISTSPATSTTNSTTTSTTNSIPITVQDSSPDRRTATTLAAKSTTQAKPASSRMPIRPIDRNRPINRPLSDSAVETSYFVMTIPEARDAAFQFRRIAETSPDLVAAVAQQNAQYADQWADLAVTHQALSERVADANWKLTTTQRDLDEVTMKLEHFGLTPTVGLLLRNKKEQLDQWQVNDSISHFARDELNQSRNRQLDLEMIRYDGSDPATQADQILVDGELDPTRLENAGLSSNVRELLRRRHRWISALKRAYQDYQQKLGELDSATTASADLTQRYRKLIDQHIIWIRSDEPLSFASLRDLKPGFAALFNSRRTETLGYSIGQKWRTNSVGGLGLVATVLGLFVVRWMARRWTLAIGNRKKMKTATASTRKVAAGILTTITALGFPAIFYVVSRWLASGWVSESTLMASSCFSACALVALIIEVPRQWFRSGGYVDKHVDVELENRSRAVTYLGIVGAGLVLAAYVITLSGLLDHGRWQGSVSRLGFILAMLLVAWTAHRSLHPSRGFLEPLIARFGGSVIHHARLVIYLVGLAFPFSMIGLSVLGYGFTANELIQRAILTVAGVSIAATLWTAVKILSSRAWNMLIGAKRPPKQFDEYGEIETDREAVVSGTLAEHYLALKHQLAFLCQCGLVLAGIACLGWLWIDVFPNVRMGNPVVWTVADTVTRPVVDAAGQTTMETVTQQNPVTALHLVLAAATLFVAFQLATLLPALFDALVLQRVSFDEGMEHFSLVIGRCLLFGIGCFIACKWVGVRWQAIQWLAVGLTIGLGFGLQDMVRNLFGGLIVLFEKPARLGDFITVGRVTGRVSAQRLRTTVLTDDDGREVIIPNKNFVGEDIVNWMGAGRLGVVAIEVAVTRDQRRSDVCRVLQELVIQQDDVLLSPAPQATQVCVSKQSQRIEIRAWIEQGKDAQRFRDALLRTVREELNQRNWLVSPQPRQPELRNTRDLRSEEDSYGTGSSSRRKRSA